MRPPPCLLALRMMNVNIEPEPPRMRSISLEPRGRPFFEDGGGAAAPPPVHMTAARRLGHLPKIQMPEFKGKTRGCAGSDVAGELAPVSKSL